MELVRVSLPHYEIGAQYTNFVYPQVGYPHLPRRDEFVHAHRMNSDKDPLLLRRELVRTGTTDSDIRSATRKGTLGRVRRGVFVPTDVLSASSPEELHALQVRAHAAAAANRLVASHESAAILHGLPMWSPNLERVHFTIDRPNGGRKSRTRHVHPGVLKSNDVVHIGGLAVTSPNRTVADLCRSLDFEAAVCVGDAALAQGVATADGVATP